MTRRAAGAMLALALAALVLHGYHPAIEDAEIYLTGVKKYLNPALYPFGAEFFLQHAAYSLFADIVAASIRWSHLPFDTAIFIWQLASIALLLVGGWQVNRACFGTERACWGGVALLAALLTVPISGTALLLFDQYFTARSISAFTTVFALAATLDRRRLLAVLWIAMTALVHPLMALFALGVVLLLLGLERRQASPSMAFALAPMGLWFSARSDAYHEVVQTRAYFFILKWTWDDWAGLLVAVALLWWFRRVAARQQRGRLEVLCRALLIWVAVCLVAAFVLTVPARFEPLARLQPMRGLHLTFIVVILVGGGFLSESVLERRLGRWLLLFVPLCCGMFGVQRFLFPSTPHVEWPGAAPRNDWVDAFLWIRANTPVDAVFALNPDHMALPGEDQHGFRLLAERSRLADAVKDSGAATMFPDRPLAEDWREQVTAQRGWSRFGIADLKRLGQQYNVTWVLLERPGLAGLECPYQNARLLVCRAGAQP